MSEHLQDSSIPLAEISHGPNAMERFLDRNQKSLLVLGILIALAGAGWVVYDGVRTGKMQTAGADLNQAADLAALQNVVKNHPGTPAEVSARILLADKQWSEGQQDAAIETLRSVLASAGSHPGLPNAMASLAAKLMVQGKPDEATSLFQELADSPDSKFLAPYALLSLGDLALAAGDSAKAEGLYKRVSTEFPSSSFSETAGRRSTMVDAKAPVEIDPPPAPKPEETPPAATDPASPIQITPAPAPAPAEEITPEATPAPESTESNPPAETPEPVVPEAVEP